MKLLRDTWLIFQRQMLLLLRNPVWVFVGIFQPVMYLLLFAPLLKPALQAPTDAEAYQHLRARPAGPAGHLRRRCSRASA